MHLEYKFRDKIKFKSMMEAYKRASDEKHYCKEIILFKMDLACNLIDILKKLYTNTYEYGNYRKFKTYIPREREIYDLPFRDKVVQQWYVEEFIKPIFKPQFIIDSYAGIEDRGVHSAMYKIQEYMKKEYKVNHDFYILKCDISKFFYNIDKRILLKILIKKMGHDKELIEFTRKTLYANTTKEIGIPIGNYSSQYFANIYLNELDHFVKEKLRIKYYVRYMDDFILLLETKEQCKYIKEQIQEYLENHLSLKFSDKKTQYFKNQLGVNFCGYKIYRNKIKLGEKNKKEINKRVKKWNYQYAHKQIGEFDYKKINNSLMSWEGHAKHETNMSTIKSIKNKCAWIYKENGKGQFIYSSKHLNKYSTNSKKSTNLINSKRLTEIKSTNTYCNSKVSNSNIKNKEEFKNVKDEDNKFNPCYEKNGNSWINPYYYKKSKNKMLKNGTFLKINKKI